MAGSDDTLYVWLESDPDIVPPDFEIEDVPGERDLDLIAAAVVAGKFGSILPVRLHYGGHREPRAGQWKSIDTARFLRDYSIRHRRRYEVLLDTIPDEFTATSEP